MVWGVVLERRPARIDGFGVLGAGALGQPLTRDRIKAGAIRLTHRLKRKRQDDRISDKSFKIHVVVLNLEVRCFSSRIREKLLNLDFDPLGDLDEAATAHAGVLRFRRRRDQDALVNGLQARLEHDRLALGDGDKALAPLIGRGRLELDFTHLAGAVGDVSDGNGERAGTMPSHVAILPLAGVEEPGDRTGHERRHVAAERGDLTDE